MAKCESCGSTISARSPWLTLKEACDYLKVSRSTMWRLIQQGLLDFGKAGNLLRIRKRNLDSFLVFQKPYNKLTIARKREIDEIADQ